MIIYLRTTFGAAKSKSLDLWRLPVAFAWFTAALSILLALSERVHFTYHSSSGIVGWIATNKYPKQQELFWYLSAVIGVPAVMLAGWVLWVVGAAAAAKLARQSAVRTLRIFAVIHLPLLIIWPRLCHLRLDAWKLLVPAAGSCLFLAATSILLMRLLDPKTEHQEQTVELPKEPPGRKARTDDDPVAKLEWVPMLQVIGGYLRISLLFAVIPIFLYLLRLDVDRNGDIDLFHDAEVLVPMDQIMKGAVPYRDIYLQHGFLRNAGIPWLGARLFEPTVAGVRAISAYVEPLGFVSFYFLVIAVCRNKLLASAFMIFLCCGSITWMPARAMFGILSLAVLAGVLQPPLGFRIFSGKEGKGDQCPDWRELLKLSIQQGWPFLLSGVLSTLAFLHSVEVGFYSFCSIVMFLGAISVFQLGISTWRRMLPALLFVAGSFVAFLPFGTYLVIHGALGDMICNVWFQSVCQNDAWGLEFPNVFSLFQPILSGNPGTKWPEWLIDGNMRWYYGPVTLVLSMAFLACSTMREGFWRSRTAPVLLLISLAGICYFRTALGRSDSAHVYCGVFFALLLVMFLSDRLFAAFWDFLTAKNVCIWRRLIAVPWLMGGLVIFPGLVWFCNTAYKPLPELKEKLNHLKTSSKPSEAKASELPRVGRSGISVEQEELIRSVSKYIREHSRPDEPVFDFSNQAGFLFFADRRPASRYFQVSYASLPKMQKEVVCDLERQKTSLVIFKNAGTFDSIDGIPTEIRHPIIYDYLKRKYELSGNAGPVIFWSRKAEASLK